MLNIVLVDYIILKEIEVKIKIQTFSHDFNQTKCKSKIADMNPNLHTFCIKNKSVKFLQINPKTLKVSALLKYLPYDKMRV